MSTPPSTTQDLLKTTTSRCPVCQRRCPAGVWKSDESPQRVFLTRKCPDHGSTTTCISSDARFYWLAKGSEGNCCGGNCLPSEAPLSAEAPKDKLAKGSACAADPAGSQGTLGRNAFAENETVEQLSTCLALIEIVDSCNLACPTCFADSPVGTNGKLLYHPLEKLQERITGVLDRKGHIEILQLSGGEPTLHPQFFALLDWIHAEPRVDYVLINTNGVLLAKDEDFLAALGQRVSRGHLQLYLQFDGPQDAGQRELRGADLRDLKTRAMERAASIGLPVTLAMTVTPVNLPHLWETIQWGLRFDNCRGISFQPEFWSGRTQDDRDERLRLRRINTADLILGMVEQAAGGLSYDDFTPLPCGDPNCATIGYLLKTPLGTRSISEFIDFAEVQGFLQDKVRYRLADLTECGCDNTALGELLKQFELAESDTFRLFIKPFMDAHTWDEDRIDRCCTHVIRPDGKLDSFCRYYLSTPGV